MAVKRFLAVIWNNKLYGDVPLRGWPICLGWVCIEDFENHIEAQRELNRLVGGQIPYFYNLCGMCCDENEVDRLRKPESVLRSRIKRLDKKCDDFPLFPEYIRAQELARTPEKYTLDDCVEGFKMRKKLIESVRLTDEYFDERMQGSNEWRDHDWAGIGLRMFREIVRSGGRADWREMYAEREKEVRGVV